jgi:hypothetical protein
MRPDATSVCMRPDATSVCGLKQALPDVLGASVDTLNIKNVIGELGDVMYKVLTLLAPHFTCFTRTKVHILTPGMDKVPVQSPALLHGHSALPRRARGPRHTRCSVYLLYLLY